MKKCNTCDNQQKYLTKGLCRKCYYVANRSHILDRKASFNKENSEKRSTYNKLYYAANKDALLSKKKEFHLSNRESALEYKKRHYSLNREKIIEQNLAYINRRSKVDAVFRIGRNLRSRLHSALKNNFKSGSAIKDLGCSIDELKSHLESQFTTQMTWDNYGPKGWHIDHIKPLCSFDLTNPEQLKEACNYKNLKPLWWTDNLSKGGRNGKS
jgi:Uri superfamily endonuclease